MFSRKLEPGSSTLFYVARHSRGIARARYFTPRDRLLSSFEVLKGQVCRFLTDRALIESYNPRREERTMTYLQPEDATEVVSLLNHYGFSCRIEKEQVDSGGDKDTCIIFEPDVLRTNDVPDILKQGEAFIDHYLSLSRTETPNPKDPGVFCE